MIAFSIIIPTYNRAELIGDAIKSVIQQQYAYWELIIIDDGSTDHTKEVVQGFSDERIRYVYQENAERSAARNRGIKMAKNPWICFLDSDDYFLEQHLSLFATAIERHPDNAFFISGQLVEKGDEMSKHPLLDTRGTTTEILEEILQKFILMNTVCIQKELIQKYGFDERFNIWEDTHLWMRISCEMSPVQLTEYSAVQRIHSDSSVQQLHDRFNYALAQTHLAAIDDFINAHHDHWKDYLSKSRLKEYKDAKLRMHIYASRTDRQLGPALSLCARGMVNKPSFYLVSEFFKSFINFLGIGLNGN